MIGESNIIAELKCRRPRGYLRGRQLAMNKALEHRSGVLAAKKEEWFLGVPGVLSELSADWLDGEPTFDEKRNEF